MTSCPGRVFQSQKAIGRPGSWTRVPYLTSCHGACGLRPSISFSLESYLMPAQQPIHCHSLVPLHTQGVLSAKSIGPNKDDDFLLAPALLCFDIRRWRASKKSYSGSFASFPRKQYHPDISGDNDDNIFIPQRPRQPMLTCIKPSASKESSSPVVCIFFCPFLVKYL